MFYKSKILTIGAAISLLLLIISFSLIYVKLSDVRHLLVLRPANLSSAIFLGSKSQVYLILISGILLNLINFFLAYVFYYRQKFWAYLLVYFNILLSSLILLIISVIINVN